MVNPLVSDRILEELSHLPPELQQRVLDFTKALAISPPKGVPGRDLVRFAGVLSKEDAEAMMQAIEQGCEKVDENGW